MVKTEDTYNNVRITKSGCISFDDRILDALCGNNSAVVADAGVLRAVSAHLTDFKGLTPGISCGTGKERRSLRRRDADLR